MNNQSCFSAHHSLLKILHSSSHEETAFLIRQIGDHTYQAIRTDHRQDWLDRHWLNNDVSQVRALSQMSHRDKFSFIITNRCWLWTDNHGCLYDLTACIFIRRRKCCSPCPVSALLGTLKHRPLWLWSLGPFSLYSFLCSEKGPLVTVATEACG